MRYSQTRNKGQSCDRPAFQEERRILEQVRPATLYSLVAQHPSWENDMAYRTPKMEEYDRRLLKVLLVTLAGLLGTSAVPLVCIL